MDVIYNLSLKKFNRLKYEEKLEVKKQGHPLLPINIEVSGITYPKFLIGF